MMKVLIDTNVILDVLLKRTPFDVDAYNILKLAEEKKINAYLAAFSITDIYYFINKNLSHNDSIKTLEALLSIVEVVSITKHDIKKAMNFKEFRGLEDALQMQCLKKLKGDLIITRDEKFQKITNKAISPKDFLSNESLN